MAKSFNSSNVKVDGFENLPFIERDANKTRHLRLDKGGIDALCGYFERI